MVCFGRRKSKHGENNGQASAAPAAPCRVVEQQPAISPPTPLPTKRRKKTLSEGRTTATDDTPESASSKEEEADELRQAEVADELRQEVADELRQDEVADELRQAEVADELRQEQVADELRQAEVADELRQEVADELRQEEVVDELRQEGEGQVHTVTVYEPRRKHSVNVKRIKEINGLLSVHAVGVGFPPEEEGFFMPLEKFRKWCPQPLISFFLNNLRFL
eukprot:GHVS01089742.1.p1 GENE.GHVS01089742.1~~GHVS01089742.1.p1  ORF type:complete len:222 (+),score=62.96 GHVS01089742.1:552-1217(+)